MKIIIIDTLRLFILGLKYQYDRFDLYFEFADIFSYLLRLSDYFINYSLAINLIIGFNVILIFKQLIILLFNLFEFLCLNIIFYYLSQFEFLRFFSFFFCKFSEFK